MLEALADAARRPVRVDGEQRGGAGLDVGQIHTGIGADEPVAGLGDQQIVPAPEDANRFRLDQLLLGHRVVGVDGDDPALSLGHHLLGHHHHVPIRQPAREQRKLPGRGDQQPGQDRRQVVTGPDLAHPGDRVDREPPRRRTEVRSGPRPRADRPDRFRRRHRGPSGTAPPSGPRRT